MADPHLSPNVHDSLDRPDAGGLAFRAIGVTLGVLAGLMLLGVLIWWILRMFQRSPSSVPITLTKGQTLVPLVRALGHRDQDQPGIARQAPGRLDQEEVLRLGFGNVEVDTYLIGDTLSVGHSCFLNPGKNCPETLREAYLQSLADRFVQFGDIYQGSLKLGVGQRFVLMVDVKSEATPTYEALNSLLAEFNARYPGFLTEYLADGSVRPGAVDVLLSGNRVSPQTLKDQPVRFAALDGRILGDLDDPARQYGPDVIPWVSQSWRDVFGPFSEGVPFSEDVSQELEGIVQLAHAQGRKVRFWATPDSEGFWTALLSKGVDIINTDDYGRLATFLRT